MNITTKFTLLCSFLVLLCGSFLFVLVNNETQESLEEEIKQKLERESNYAIGNIDRFIAERLNDIQIISNDAVLGSDTATYNQIRQRLLLFKQQNKLYVSVSFFDNNRVRIADTESKSVGKRHSFSKYWVKAEQRDVLLDISYSESLQEAVMHFVAVVRNKEGRRIGLVVSRVLIRSLYQVFSDVIEDSKTPNLYVTLLDTNGVMLYSNQLKDSILTHKYKDFDLLQKQITNQQTAEQPLRYFEQDNQIYFYTFQQGYLNYEGHDWIFVMSLPKKTAFAAAKTLRYKIYYVFFPVMFVSVLLAILFGRYFSKPIVQLSRVAKILGAGHLDVKFELQSHRHDEIGVLATQLQQMGGQLARKIKEQEELNQELSATNQKLEELYFDVEKYNRNMKASINYAERIQWAMLPKLSQIQSFFSEVFVLFKPKNVVSGDFYFFHEIQPQAQPQALTPNKQVSNQLSKQVDLLATFANANKTTVLHHSTTKTAQKSCVLAVIDCTGHGVPGALMSVIGYNILQQVIVYEKLVNPSQILCRLNEEVQRMLNQEHTQNKDGMDIALCYLDEQNQTLQFAGVHRPLLYVNQAGELQEIKGDKITIGGSFRQTDPWQVLTHTLDLQQVKSFYLFSDGYADQFNGELPPTKFKNKALRELLLQIHSLDMPTQQQILEQEHNNWRGHHTQTDDILVIGAKPGSNYLDLIIYIFCIIGVI